MGVKEADAKAAYAALMDFKDVVKAHPISHAEVVASEVNPKIVAAAETLSAKAYPFLKEVNWNSDVFQAPLPGVGAKAALKGVLSALKMGEKMDPKVLHGAVEAHHKAIAGVDANGIPSEADFAAINAGLGQLIASVPQSSTMDVYCLCQDCEPRCCQVHDGFCGVQGRPGGLRRPLDLQGHCQGCPTLSSTCIQGLLVPACLGSM